jgi:hypothetical protein
VNGSAGERFWQAKGLRQGDLISPTLFLVMMDVFTAIIRLVEDHGLFAPFQRSGIRYRLSLFVDNVVMLIKPSTAEAEAAIQLLHHFGQASGLYFNLMKSSALPIRCDGVVDIQPIVMTILGCRVHHFPVQYLGHPLSLIRLSKRDLQPLVDKVAAHMGCISSG